jgi:hypothetical protein
MSMSGAEWALHSDCTTVRLEGALFDDSQLPTLSALRGVAIWEISGLWDAWIKVNTLLDEGSD